ncbi:MAG: PTS sugar transporter subunit IIA [Sebaldella sp.]|nr:PTS sugar transporter subunit IIA [Sebaldella sp.]
MKISNFISKELVFLNVEAETIDDLIVDILNKASLVDNELKKNLLNIKETVLKREKEACTALGHGIIIPHGRIENYEDTTVIAGTLKNPIKTIVRNKIEEVDVFFFIISGLTKNRMILKLMSLISFLSHEQEFLDKIGIVEEPDEFIKIIQENENDVKQTVSSEDLMDTEVAPVLLTESMEEVSLRFIAENKTGLPVIDEKGNFVGEITEREIIEFGMPKYASLVSDLSFMTIGEPFEEYFLNSTKVAVREIYRKSKNVIDKKASIMEICFKMITEGNTRLYIVEDNKYFGMIERRDIIEKFLHI